MELEWNVRESAFVSCHTRIGLSFTSQMVTAQSSLATLSSTPSSPPKTDRTSAIPAQLK